MNSDVLDTIEAALRNCPGVLPHRQEALAEVARLREAGPQPDWSQAPEWAEWWAVDPDGYYHWFDNEPILTEQTSHRELIGPHWSHYGRKYHLYDAVNIPLGVDWRTLKCRRTRHASGSVAELICREVRDDLQAEIDRLTAELTERDASFELRNNADMRAIAMWQEATGKELMWPNHADMCVWLMGQLAAANARIAEYERPLPTMEDGRYKITCDHRFTDEGICVRCGEDAEEWDAGCVESIVNDVLDAEDKLAAKDAELDRLREELAKARANERKPMRVFRNTLGDDALISYLMDGEGDTDEQ